MTEIDETVDELLRCIVQEIRRMAENRDDWYDLDLDRLLTKLEYLRKESPNQ